MTAKTQIVKIPVESLVPADWNYKKPATDEQLEKLVASITHDGSAGVLAVRELGDGMFEVIDGNHRYDAVVKMGWEEVPCENFGEISIAQAVVIARRRNEQWFESDDMAFAALLKNEVLTEFTLAELETFMPESIEDLQALTNMLDFDWQQPAPNDSPGDDEDEGTELTLKLSVETLATWNQYRNNQPDDDHALSVLLANNRGIS